MLWCRALSAASEPSKSTVFPRLTWLDAAVLLLIVAWGLLRLAPGLGHPAIWNWDESFHQVVARHTHDKPWMPMLFDDPVHPLTDLKQWWAFNVWLHKPVAPFWLGGLMMTFTGATPLALRLGSLLGELVMACCVYYLGLALARRWAAALASLAFLSLPFGWIMTQGRYVGDVTDITLSACICVAVLALLKSVEADSWKWSLFAGAAAGAGYLCKSFLSLTPIGIAGVMFALSLTGFCRGPRLKSVIALLAGAVAVAGPWNLYAYVRWPDVYRRVLLNTLGFVDNAAAEDLAHGIRPIDAIFNEINPHNYEPMGAALVVLAGAWLLIKALRGRNHLSVGAAIWLWSTWIGHSMMSVKGHAHLWNSLVPEFVAVATLMVDAFRSLPVAFATVAGVATPQLMKWLPVVSDLRPLLPPKLDESRRIPGLVEGLVFVTAAVAVGWVLSRIRPLQRRWLIATGGVVAAGMLAWLVLPEAVSRQNSTRDAAQEEFNIAYSREVGHALDAETPKQSLVLFEVDVHPKDQFENMNLMFYSDRLVHTGRDPQDYPQAGYHPWLVTSAAEPFAPLEAVPAYSWLRAYDLTKPLAEPAPVPAGVTPLDVAIGHARVLGYAAGDNDSHHGHYAFFVRPNGAAVPLNVVFQTKNGPVQRMITPEASLLARHKLANVSWYIAPTLGPPRDEVFEIDFGPAPEQRVAFSGGT
jgi:4-amino-4-deoxy-L-arabinose transferase-like glycosyltransferase